MDFINGEILYLNKPLHWTSFDVVNRVRHILCRTIGQKKLKVGHAGTLDPLAKRIAGFTGWAFGRGATPRSVCWQPKATPSVRRPMSTSSLFLPSRPTAKSPTKPVTRSWPSWAICPAWSCSQGRPRPDGTYGATRWSPRFPASGHGGQRIAERRTSHAVCERPQRLVQDQDENCL